MQIIYGVLWAALNILLFTSMEPMSVEWWQIALYAASLMAHGAYVVEAERGRRRR